MTEPPSERLVDVDGLTGHINRTLRRKSSQGSLVLLEMADGRRVWAPEDWLEARNGEYFLPHRASHLQSAPVSDDGAMVVPVLEETVQVRRRKRVTGVVRVTKRVRTRDEVVEPVRAQETVEVERVPVNRIVAEPPPVRQEGNVMVVPVLEEVLVVEKRLVLREELRITRTRHEIPERHQFTLRREEAEIERLAGEELPEEPSTSGPVQAGLEDGPAGAAPHGG